MKTQTLVNTRRRCDHVQKMDAGTFTAPCTPPSTPENLSDMTGGHLHTPTNLAAIPDLAGELEGTQVKAAQEAVCMHAALSAAMSSGAWHDTPKVMLPKPEIHTLDPEILEQVLGSSIKMTNEACAADTPMASAGTMASLTHMLEAHGVPSAAQDAMLATIIEVCEESNRQTHSRATERLATHVQNLMAPVLTCANSDLTLAQNSVAQLQSTAIAASKDSTQATQALCQARLDIAVREKQHRQQADRMQLQLTRASNLRYTRLETRGRECIQFSGLSRIS